MTVFSNQQLNANHQPSNGGFSMIYNPEGQSVCVEFMNNGQVSFQCTKEKVVMYAWEVD